MDSKKAVYDEYCDDMKSAGLPTLDNYQHFVEMWSALFPDLHCRVYVDIPGKCETCFRIDALRKCGDNSLATIEALKKCHHLHRGMFMQERAK